MDWQAEMAVVTPESVIFTYEMAGIGSRFLAVLVDHIIESCFLLAIGIALSILRLKLDFRLLLASELLFFYVAYFVFFEILWDGQTPGKRLLRLRVVREGGYGLTAMESILRNLLRVIDAMPGFYGIGLVSMLLSGKSRRLGDFVAGTVVIKEQRAAPPTRVKLIRNSILNGLGDETRILIRGRLGTFSPEELRAMREFLRRRHELAHAARQTLAAKLNAVVLRRIPELAELARTLPGERLLDVVVAVYEEVFV